MSSELLHFFGLWTGRLAAIFLILNFTTCFVMPWARNKLPFKGSKPGKDDKDKFGAFQFTAVHKIFAWATIISVIGHIIVIILESQYL